MSTDPILPVMPTTNGRPRLLEDPIPPEGDGFWELLSTAQAAASSSPQGVEPAAKPPEKTVEKPKAAPPEETLSAVEEPEDPDEKAEADPLVPVDTLLLPDTPIRLEPVDKATPVSVQFIEPETAVPTVLPLQKVLVEKMTEAYKTARPLRVDMAEGHSIIFKFKPNSLSAEFITRDQLATQQLRQQLAELRERLQKRDLPIAELTVREEKKEKPRR